MLNACGIWLDVALHSLESLALALRWQKLVKEWLIQRDLSTKFIFSIVLAGVKSGNYGTPEQKIKD